jgi:hypothetical protein
MSDDLTDRLRSDDPDVWVTDEAADLIDQLRAKIAEQKAGGDRLCRALIDAERTIADLLAVPDDTETALHRKFGIHADVLSVPTTMAEVRARMAAVVEGE